MSRAEKWALMLVIFGVMFGVGATLIIDDENPFGAPLVIFGAIAVLESFPYVVGKRGGRR